MDWKRVGMPIGAAALILMGVLVLDWANTGAPFGATIRFAALGDELCLADQCVALTKGHGTWRAIARVVVVLGGLTALSMIGVAVVRALAIELGPLDRAVTWLCVTLLGCTGMAMVATGAGLGDLGAGGLVTLAGAAIGLVGKAAGSSASFGAGRSARPIRSAAVVAPAATDPYRDPAAPAAAPTRRAAPPVVEPDRDRRPSNPAPLNKGMVRLAAAGPVAADATRSALRFVVTEGALTPTGLVLRFDRGGPRTVPWSALVEVVVRRMPPDPPWEKTAFVDLVFADGPPARLLPTTRLDLTELPGGLAPNTKENWRRLVAHAREHNPAIVIEADSRDFFAGGRDPVMFPALKKFVEWDRRYG